MMYPQPYHLYSPAVEGPPSPSYEGCESPSVMSDSFDPMDYSPSGSSVPGILQARIREWVAIPSPGDLPDPGIDLRFSHCRQFFFFLLSEPPGKPSYEGYLGVILGNLHQSGLDPVRKNAVILCDPKLGDNWTSPPNSSA